MTVRKPDACAREAMKILGYAAIAGEPKRIDEVRRVAQGLRRQHAAIERLVRRQQRYILSRVKRPANVVKDDCGPYIMLYDLLAALRRRRG